MKNKSLISFEKKIELRSDLFHKLMKYVDEKLERWCESNPPKFTSGDVLIFDKYNLNNGENTWDGGVSTILGEYKNSPPFDVHVTHVVVSKMFYAERISEFISQIDLDYFLLQTTNVLINYYENYLNGLNGLQYGLQINNKYGFYYEVHFKPSVKIPTYPLNENCFIKKGTKKYDDTKKYWETISNFEYKISNLKDELSRLTEEKNSFIKEWHGLN